MALVLPPPSMTTSILLSPSPSPASTPLPALHPDLSSSSSSASGSCLDLYHSSAPSTRRIRFAPLPDPRRDLLDPSELSSGDPQLEPKPATQPLPASSDLPDGFVALSPTISLDSTLSSARSTPTIRVSPHDSSHSRKSNMKLLRPFSFLLRSHSSSPIQSPSSPPASLPGSRDSARSSSSLPSSPSLRPVKLSRFSTEDILTLGTKSFFRARSGSTSSTCSARPSSPPPKFSGSSRFLHRPASIGSSPSMTLGTGKRDVGDNSSQLHDTIAIAGSGTKKRRASSQSTPGAGGGRHACSVKLPSNDPPRPSTAPSSPITAPTRRVKMLNGRVYGAKRYAAQTLANPFANVRDEPEFVEWGYGGMGSVHASAGIANDMWKGLQRSERGGALLAGSSFGSASQSDPTVEVVTAGGDGGSAPRVTSPVPSRRMSVNVPECSMGNVGASGMDEDDGSGMGWLKRRRAEREAKAQLEQQAKGKPHEGRKSIDSMDASINVSTASSLTACTSAASTDLTTPSTSPLVSRSPSLADLNLTSSTTDSRDLRATPRAVSGEQFQKSDTLVHPSKDEHQHHVLTAVRLSPSISNKYGHSSTPLKPSLSRTLVQIDKVTGKGSSEQIISLSPADTEEVTTSTSSSGENGEEPSKNFDDGEERDVDEDDEDDEGIQDIGRKTALGAGVEKISRHVDVEVR